ncbi:uncharacterized protein LOC142177312 [Nicotiana tabacum]|uniref:Uncharacterized protein LOC142177312 n=1 Tax=Nicotiana tabacum TaxID=4097 RepID=A0AC58TXD5_TOBAC
MVTSWLLNSLSKDIGDSVIYSKMVRNLWNSLEYMFVQSNGTKLYQLQKKISASVQGNSSVSSYFTILKKLWDEMDSLSSHLNCSCDCVCGGKAKVAKILEDQRILQFLMGLNDVYARARGNILMMSPLPSMDFAYSLLLQDENQREAFVNLVSPQHNSDASSFMVGAQTYNNQGQRGWSASSKFGNNQQKNKARKAKYNSQYDFQFTKSNDYQAAVKWNAVMGGQDNEINPSPSNKGDVGSQNESFSREQISELVNIIKQVQVGNTGASEHMCFDSSSFLELSSLPIPVHISSPNSFQLYATHIGRVSIQNNMVPLVGEGQVFGEIRGGLYLLKPVSISEESISSSNDEFSIPKRNHSSLVSSTVSCLGPISRSTISDVIQWHARLGHLPFEVMKALSFLKLFFTMTEKQFNIKVKKVRSDNALELGKGSQQSDFLLSHGILHETYCVGTPQQNEIVERKHRHLLEVARSLFFQSKVPIQYWSECILTATYLVNRFLSSVLKGKTLYQILFGKPHVYDSLKVFGYFCYASTLAHNKGKFDPKAHACAFLGYSQHQKGYKLLELKPKTVFVSRDVKLYENHFPFVTTPTSQSYRVFPPIAPLSDNTIPNSIFSSPSYPSSFPSPWPIINNIAPPDTKPITLPSPRTLDFSSLSPNYNSPDPFLRIVPNPRISSTPVSNPTSPLYAPNSSITITILIPPPPIRKSE